MCYCLNIEPLLQLSHHTLEMGIGIIIKNMIDHTLTIIVVSAYIILYSYTFLLYTTKHQCIKVRKKCLQLVVLWLYVEKKSCDSPKKIWPIGSNIALRLLNIVIYCNLI